MTDLTTTDAGRRYAFAPHPDPIEDVLYRIHVVVEEPDGRLWVGRNRSHGALAGVRRGSGGGPEQQARPRLRHLD